MVSIATAFQKLIWDPKHVINFLELQEIHVHVGMVGYKRFLFGFKLITY